MPLCRKVYLDCRYGQIHARICGDGEPVVLLHWTPGSGAMLTHIAEALAERGYQAWTLDLLGFGRSDRPPPGNWTQAMHGAAVGDAVESAGLKSVTLCGGHMSAEVALECALDRPALVARLVLDGVACDWDPDMRKTMIGTGNYHAPAYDKDGTPVTWAWDRTLWIWGAWRPGLEVNEETAPTLHQAVIDLMETGFDISPMAQSFGAYRAVERLKKAQHSVLALTADSDTLRDHFPATMNALPDACGYVFKGVHPAHRPDGGPDYAHVLDAFIKGRAYDWLSAGDDLKAPGTSPSAYTSS